jgi:predicted ATP-dependent protease
MPALRSFPEVPIDQLRRRVDPAKLPFETTNDLEACKDIIGQQRAVEAFRLGLGIETPGYNIFVTGSPGSGRLTTVKRLLHKMVVEEKIKDRIPDDLCYVNNFKLPDAPILIRFPAGKGRQFKKDMEQFVERLKKEIPQVFESEDYLNMKKEVLDRYAEQGKRFFKELANKLKEEGFALVEMQIGPYKRPEVMPIINDKPYHIDQLEHMTEEGQFPQEELNALKEKYERLRDQIDRLFHEMRDMEREVHQKVEDMDRLMFKKTASDHIISIKTAYVNSKLDEFLNAMVEDMADNLGIFRTTPQQQQQQQGLGMPVPTTPMPDVRFQPYEVNLLVDNSECTGPPIIIETNPTYRNLFGGIERIIDRTGMWRTDFSKIKVGSLVQANGGYLVFNLLDAIMEPGVWQAFKRSMKSGTLETQIYDPFYLFTTGLKPEPIKLDTKVVAIGDSYLYNLLLAFDPDTKKIFKVRADFSSDMDVTDENVSLYARIIKDLTDEEKLSPLDRFAVTAIIEHGIREAGRQEKVSIRFPEIANLIREACHFARLDHNDLVTEKHVDQAIQAQIYRSNLVEERIQEFIDRGTLMIDTEGAVVGQVNGLAVFSLGDYAFGKPSRITVSTSMGRAGIINIERESDLSGSTHNKGVLILSGYLRKKYAQDKPLTMSASICFEQSYSGVDGDSASSTEIYAILSSLSGLPLRQDLAVTGSVNQKGEVQPIGGVNEKIEGFYHCCRVKGLTGNHGVLIPIQNVKDLMLRKDVIRAVEEGKFHIYPVAAIDQGIEILTGVPSGERDENGEFPPDTVNRLVDDKLRELAEGLKSFGEEEEAKAEKEKKGCQTCG